MVGKLRKQVRAITKAPLEDIIRGIGSPTSIWIHTGIFVLAFLVGMAGWYSWELILLVVTTIVSLEAIYLALFIQMSVNRNTDSLRNVEEDIDEIEEDLEDLTEEDKEEEEREKQQSETLEQLTTQVQQLLEHVETLKKR